MLEGRLARRFSYRNFLKNVKRHSNEDNGVFHVKVGVHLSDISYSELKVCEASGFVTFLGPYKYDYYCHKCWQDANANVSARFSIK